MDSWRRFGASRRLLREGAVCVVAIVVVVGIVVAAVARGPAGVEEGALHWVV